MKVDWSNPVIADIVKGKSLINQLMDDKIAEMKAACDEQCRSVLIAKGIASDNMTPYEWRRLARLLESRSDGITYYFSQTHEIPVYEVRYYEPPMPDWTNIKEPYTIQLGAYQVIPL